MLTIEFFGQACTAMRCQRSGVEVVSDPWFSSTAHVDSWHAHPEWTTDELQQIRERVDRASHIYLSHNHADHFDPEFLGSLNRKTIIVGDFQNLRFRKQLAELSSRHEIRFVRHGETLALSDEVSAQLFLQQPAFRTDSMLLLTTPDGVVLNANDCGLDSHTLRNITRKGPPTVFLFTLNFMASGYPISYLYSRQPSFEARMQAVRNEVVSSFELAMDSLKPQLSAAFAGPVTFGDAVNTHLNSHPESCDWKTMLGEVQQKGPVVWPAPFSTIECVEGAVVRKSIEDWKPYQERPALSSRPLPPAEFNEADLLESANAFVLTLSTVLQKMNERAGTTLVLSGVGCLERIETDQPDWSIELDFDNQAVRSLGQTAPRAPNLQIVAPSSIILKFLSHEINIDELLLSARARFRRDPDTFNQVLHNLLRYGRDELTSRALVDWYVRRAKCPEALEIEVGGEKRRIPRLCPHEGENLESAPITDGVLVCPRHRWKFDLTTGQCVAGDRAVNLYTLVDQRGN